MRDKFERTELIRRGLDELSIPDYLKGLGRNGDALDHDEAAVWKRVLNVRVASYLGQGALYESHPGLGISSHLYSKSGLRPVGLDWDNDLSLVDIDPFGQPWDTLAASNELHRRARVLMVSNGEALAVRRNLKRVQRFPTNNYGRRLPYWVVDELIPHLELITDKKCQFFYAFPTTVRAILSNESLPKSLWEGCPKWMWWLHEHAP